MGCGNFKRHPLTSSSFNAYDGSKLKISQEKSIETTVSHISDYAALSFLGAGGFSEVMACKHLPTNSYRALKFISKSKVFSHTKTSSNLLKEVSLLQNLTHPKILHIHEYFEDSDNIYIATELCKGNSLYSRLRKQGNFSETTLQEIYKQVFQALAYIHSQNIVHRDIKPENILLVSPSENTIKVADFGSASELNINKKSKGCYGTSIYLAPEILNGEYNEKVDIWSAGISLYILISGKNPYNEVEKEAIYKKIKENPFQINEICRLEVSKNLKDLLRKMLEIDPDKRISAEEALDHLWFKG